MTTLHLTPADSCRRSRLPPRCPEARPWWRCRNRSWHYWVRRSTDPSGEPPAGSPIDASFAIACLQWRGWSASVSWAPSWVSTPSSQTSGNRTRGRYRFGALPLDSLRRDETESDDRQERESEVRRHLHLSESLTVAIVRHGIVLYCAPHEGPCDCALVFGSLRHRRPNFDAMIPASGDEDYHGQEGGELGGTDSHFLTPFLRAPVSIIGRTRRTSARGCATRAVWPRVRPGLRIVS